jgi:hypothetical protein
LIRLKPRIFDRQNNLYENKEVYHPEDPMDIILLYLTLLTLSASPAQVLEGRGARQWEFMGKISNADIYDELFFNLSTGTNLGKEIKMPVGRTLFDDGLRVISIGNTVLPSKEELERKGIEGQTDINIGKEQ